MAWSPSLAEKSVRDGLFYFLPLANMTEILNAPVPDFDKLVAERIKREQTDSNVAARWITSFFIKVPRIEIFHVLKELTAVADRYKSRIGQFGTPDQQDAFVSILTYLSLAAMETNFAKAWSYINLADAHLPLIVDEHELKSVVQRLHTGDNRLDPQKTRFSKSIDPDYKYVNANRYDLHGRQKARAALWNSVNSRVVIKNRLWLSAGIWLLVGLSSAIGIAEYLTGCTDVTIDKTAIPYPFLFVSVLGAFGGAISAYRSVPDYIVEISSFQLLKLLLVLRMLLGAAGSFVVFISVYWLGTDEIVSLLQKNMFAFIGMAIVAGFSERLLLDALNRMAENLSINALPAQPKKKEPAEEPGAESQASKSKEISPREAFHNLTPEEKEIIVLELIKTNRDRWFSEYQGIKSIEIGHKITGSAETKEVCITFIVAKKHINMMSGKIPVEFPSGDYAVPTDVIEATETEVLSETGAGFIPRICGTGISRQNNPSTGTIGFKAQRKINDNAFEYYLVSCFHVIFNNELYQTNRKFKISRGDTVDNPVLVCPSYTDRSNIPGGANPYDQIGNASEGELTQETDFAIAKINNNGEPLRTEILNLQSPTGTYTPRLADKEKGFNVKMHGRMSGYQSGKLLSTYSTPVLPYDDGKLNWPMRGLFRTSLKAVRGDSGSAVLDDNNRIIGIVNGKDSSGTYVVPIEACLKNYNLEICK